MNGRVPIFKISDFEKMRSHPDKSLSLPMYEDFILFLKHSIDTELYQDRKEEGIIKVIINKGTDALTEKQLWVINRFLDRVLKSCSRCGIEFSFQDMTFSEGDLCPSCQHDWDRLNN